MINLFAAIDVKVFAEGNELIGFCDNYFHGKGVNSPDLYEPLLVFRNKTIELSMADKSTLGDFREAIFKTIWNKESNEVIGNLELCFAISDNLYMIDNPDKLIKNAVNECLDQKSVGKINICFIVYEDAGSYYIDRKTGLHYDFHFRESTQHHAPHIHVSDKSKGFDVSINILNGKLLPPNFKLNPKYSDKYKCAKKYIMKNKKKLIREWRRFTLGLVSLNDK
jgi:hypothetical protein